MSFKIFVHVCSFNFCFFSNSGVFFCFSFFCIFLLKKNCKFWSFFSFVMSVIFSHVWLAHFEIKPVPHVFRSPCVFCLLPDHPEFLSMTGLELVYRCFMVKMLDHHELLEKTLLLSRERWSGTDCGSGSLLLTGHVAFAKDSVQPRIVEDPLSRAIIQLRYHLN